MSILNQQGLLATEEVESTQEKILGCASERFAHQGFQKTTVQEICQCAGANIAAVNYHFGSKGELYLGVWKRAARLSEKMVEQLDALSSPEEWIRQVVQQRIQVIFTEGPGSWIPNMIHHEMHNHSEYFDEIFKVFLRPMQARFMKQVAVYLGPKATPFQVQSAVDSVMGFFPMLNHMRHHRKIRLSPEEILQLTQQTQVYILGGLAAIKKNIEEETP